MQTEPFQLAAYAYHTERFLILRLNGDGNGESQDVNATVFAGLDGDGRVYKQLAAALCLQTQQRTSSVGGRGAEFAELKRTHEKTQQLREGLFFLLQNKPKQTSPNRAGCLPQPSRAQHEPLSGRLWSATRSSRVVQVSPCEKRTGNGPPCRP